MAMETIGSESVGVSRRTFVAAAAVLSAGAGIASATGANAAHAESAPEIDVDSIPAVGCDVLVCGAGAAGLNAAASAAEEGLKVVCVEKCSLSCAGGNNYGFINSQYLLDAGSEPVDVVERTNAVVQAHMGGGDPLLTKRFVEANAEVGEWMEQISHQTGHTYELNILEGAAMTNYDDVYAMMSEYLVSLGGEVVYDAPVVKLLTDGSNRVTGAIVQNTETGEYARYETSKGVVLATGGIGGNPDLIRKYLPWCDPDGLFDAEPNAAQGGENGDAIPLCEEIGAAIGDGLFSEQVHFLTGYWPAEGVLFVDKAGQRIPDNDTCCNVNEVRIHIVMGRPGHRGWAITDSKDGWAEVSNPMAAVNPDYEAHRATCYDTLADVAAAFGLDSEGLESTVAEWNEMVETGVDDLYGTDLSSAMKIDTPPYHVSEAKGATMAFMGGPLVDSRLRVVDADHRPFEGLYAIGNCCCGFWGPDYVMTLWAGMNKSWAAVTGYLAGKDVAAL